MSSIPKWKELQSLSDEELISKYDSSANNTIVGTGFYREELSRRATNKQNDEMVNISRSVKNMTIAILVLTVFNVALVGVTLLEINIYIRNSIGKTTRSRSHFSF